MSDKFRNFNVTFSADPVKQGLFVPTFTITYEQKVDEDWQPITVIGFNKLPEDALQSLAANSPDVLPANIRALDGNPATAIRILIEARARGYFFFK